MTDESMAEIREVIIEWLSHKDCPIDLSPELIEEIAEKCEEQALDKTRSKFRKDISEIVSESVKLHLMGGGK